MSDKEILEKLRLTQLPEEAQKQMLQAVNQELETRLAGVIDDIMNNEQRDQLESKLQGTPEEVFAWLSSEITDVAKLYEEALEDYIEEVNSKVNNIVE